jgi:acetyl-CoA/propionyl-CoA carboxylase biotin carboxyl carrier protein
MMTGDFGNVLIANRGEIAVRVIRTCRDLGLRTIAVYADGDTDAPHVRMADQAMPLPGATAAQTYLNIPALLDAAAAAGAEAVHPGYGFLSESAEFAAAVQAAGMIWIGPPPSAIEALGNKVTAREIALRVGAPLVAGTSGPVSDASEVQDFARRHGLPIAIKAAFGGGGRGMRVVREMGEVRSSFDAARREALLSFGRDECFVERYLDRPRHVEAQVLADTHGTVVVVGTRDCSLQRRHQKLVEEAPAPFLSDEQLTGLREAAEAVCREAGYVGAGTVEFLLDAAGALSFLEVNTRLQVEHPVTEETTGLDLVAEQIGIAKGLPLTITSMPQPVGHAFEFRINCEDPIAGFVPRPGVVEQWKLPEGPGIRIDSGVEQGSVISGQFDSMVAKLIVSGPDRRTALARSRRALAETAIVGVPTVLGFDAVVLRDPDFIAADGHFGVYTEWIQDNLDRLVPSDVAEPDPDKLPVTIGRKTLWVNVPGLSGLGERAAAIAEEMAQIRSGTTDVDDRDEVVSPMQGTVVAVAVVEGDRVELGDPIAVVEAMKMENRVVAHRSGVVTGLTVTVGDTRGQGETLCRVVA